MHRGALSILFMYIVAAAITFAIDLARIIVFSMAFHISFYIFLHISYLFHVLFSYLYDTIRCSLTLANDDYNPGDSVYWDVIIAVEMVIKSLAFRPLLYLLYPFIVASAIVAFFGRLDIEASLDPAPVEQQNPDQTDSSYSSTQASASQYQQI